MANRPGSRSPSLTFLGALIGVVCCFVAPIDFLVYWIDHPSEAYLVIRLMLYTGLGMAAGAIAEVRRARRHREPA